MSLFFHPVFRWIGKKRGEWTVTLAAVVVVHASMKRDVAPMDLLQLSSSTVWAMSWLLLAVGVGIRIWAAGNLRKKEEVTMTGVYAMVRHPLYLGTFLIYLGGFLALGNLEVGIPALGLIVLGVYYPRIVQEEAALIAKFPNGSRPYLQVPALLPNPLLAGAALRTDKFSVRMAAKNVGLRSLWAFVLIPLLVKCVIWIKAA